MSVFQATQSEGETGAVSKRLLWAAMGLVLAIALSVLGLAAFAALLYFGNVSEKWIIPAVTVLSLFSLFASALLAARKSGIGFWMGAGLGALYFLLLHLGARLMGGGDFGIRTVLLMLIGALTAGIGTSLSKNMGGKKKKRKRKK